MQFYRMAFIYHENWYHSDIKILISGELQAIMIP